MRFYVYQLFKEPMPEQEWTALLSINPHSPPVPYAANLTPVKDRNHVLERLRRWLKLYGLGDINKGCIILSPSAKKTYFKHRFASFRNAMLDLSSVDLDRFIAGDEKIAKAIFTLRDSYMSTSDCHILLENGNLMPMDQFMRTAEAKKAYYIGAVMEFYYLTPDCL